MYDGFEELIGDLERYIAKVEKSEDIIEVGVKEFVKDLDRKSVV